MSRRLKKKTCYVCSSPAVSREHVPPLGIFPDDQREQLVTVPSCEAHNWDKSGDDEYLRLVLASLIAANDEAMLGVWPKVMRSFTDFPAKMHLLKNPRPARIGNVNTGVFEIDVERFVSVMTMIVKGLYYSIFKRVWAKDVCIIPPAGSFINLEDPGDKRQRETLEVGFNQNFGSLPKYGANPQIFYCQYFGDQDAGLMKIVFYEGVVIIAALDIQHLIASLVSGGE